MLPRGLDLPTRAALGATVLAVLGLLVPPVGLGFALVAIVCATVARRRARRNMTTNRVANACLVVCGALVLVVVIGSAIYAAA